MAEMTARMRRVESDWNQVRKDFAGHRYIMISPVGEFPPEKYHVTFFVNGIYLLPDGRIETLGRHEVDIILHADYPRYKPICRITTPIWHPNFRDGQICIGDIWGAGESLSDIIINIGDMIQYKSWNSFSPLCAEAAQWAIENKHLFPVGNLNLHMADYSAAKDSVHIDMFNLSGDPAGGGITGANQPAQPEYAFLRAAIAPPKPDDNDFEITAEELAGIEFVPTAQRMQTLAHGGTVPGKKINLKTVLVKGVLWALIGALLGFGVSEILSPGGRTRDAAAARLCGHAELVEFYEAAAEAGDAYKEVWRAFVGYCKRHGLNPDADASMTMWLNNLTDREDGVVTRYLELSEQSEEILYDAYLDFDGSEEEFGRVIARIQRVDTGMWSAILALFIGLLLGVGEGVYYGSKEQAIRYALIGSGMSLIIGFISGYCAQWMYVGLLGDGASGAAAAFVRGLGWALMGLGIGAAIGLIRPASRRMLFCALGGLGGAFIGGFLFDYVCNAIPNDLVARGIAIVIMGLLIGVGVGLLEQFAKQAWLKVIRGEFEGKEYLVFAGTTSIGNNGKNTIVLFKDKLVAPHHCDIVLEGGKYIAVDQGSPLGTIVNGARINRRVLRQGDAIAVGNSVLVFHTR